jgi:hypothetical protein
LLTPYNLEIRIPSPDSGEAQGDLAFGVVELETGDEDLDARLSESWEGREATIKVGGTYDVGLVSEGSLSFAQFVPILLGTVDRVGWSEGRIVLTLREKLQKLSEPLQSLTYAGTGGLEGTEAIQGLRKPLRFGPQFNIEPVLVKESQQIYQWSSGAVDGVDEVRDNGVALVSDGDVADIEAASAPSGGHYITQNSGGYIRLGGVPDGRITLDGRGDKTGGVYVSTTAEIAKRMATRVGLVDPADFDGASFSGFPDTREVGIGFAAGEEVTAGDAIARLLAGIWGWVSTTRQGTLRIGKFFAPEVMAPAVTITDDTLDEIEEESSLPPAWRVEIEYARNGTPQDSDALSDQLSAADRELYSQPFRLAAYEDAAVKTTHKDARVVRIASYLASSTDAAALAQEIHGVLSVRRRTYRARVERQMFARQPADVADIISADSDLSTGRHLLILSMAEDAAERMNQWELWG